MTTVSLLVFIVIVAFCFATSMYVMFSSLAPDGRLSFLALLDRYMSFSLYVTFTPISVGVVTFNVRSIPPFTSSPSPMMLPF